MTATSRRRAKVSICSGPSHSRAIERSLASPPPITLTAKAQSRTIKATRDSSACEIRRLSRSEARQTTTKLALSPMIALLDTRKLRRSSLAIQISAAINTTVIKQSRYIAENTDNLTAMTTAHSQAYSMIRLATGVRSRRSADRYQGCGSAPSHVGAARRSHSTPPYVHEAAKDQGPAWLRSCEQHRQTQSSTYRGARGSPDIHQSLSKARPGKLSIKSCQRDMALQTAKCAPA